MAEVAKILSPEETRRKAALAAVAELGGQLTNQEDITFEGTRFVLPARMSLAEAVKFLKQRAEDEENESQFTYTFNYRPWDMAHALSLAIKEAFGMTMGKTLRSFFGDTPPKYITINTGPGRDDKVEVPWGAMFLPGLENTTLHAGTTRHAEYGLCGAITIEGPRKYRHIFAGLAKLIEDKLDKHSIYRGKAIDGSEQFLDVSTIDKDDFVYTADALAQLDTNIWGRIRFAEAYEKLGQKPKRACLLEGPFGTGKSGAGLLTAQVALAHGWTFFMVRPGRDDIAETLQMARMYQPSVVFQEDVDTIADAGATDIPKTLDLFDGIQTKGLKLMIVMTTNHADLIHKGMVRPGRLDAVIHIGEMEPAGIEKLTRRVIGNKLAADIDWDRVVKAMDGYYPAFVREALDRAVGYSVTLNNGVLGEINTDALEQAAQGLRAQLKLMEDAKDRGSDHPMDVVLGGLVRRQVGQVLVETKLVDKYDDEIGRLELKK